MSQRRPTNRPVRDGWWSETDTDGWGGDSDDQPALPLGVTVAVNGRQVDPTDNPLTPPPGKPTGHVNISRSEAARAWWRERHTE